MQYQREDGVTVICTLGQYDSNTRSVDKELNTGSLNKEQRRERREWILHVEEKRRECNEKRQLSKERPSRSSEKTRDTLIILKDPCGPDSCASNPLYPCFQFICPCVCPTNP